MSQPLRYSLSCITALFLCIALPFGSPSDAAAQTTTIQRLDTTNPETNGNFGFSVATDGLDLIVGARRENTTHGSNAGRVYIYTPDPATSTWTLDLQSGAPSTEQDAFLGQAVAITDGVAFGGAPFDDITGSSDGGSVYQYENDGTGYAYETAYPEPDLADGGWFGNGMATDGTHLVVGAQRGTTADEAGAVTVFFIDEETDGSTTLTRTGGKIRPSDRQDDQRFGLNVSVWGEQGGEVVLGGAPLRDYDSGTDRGSLYGFRRGTSGGWEEFFRLSPDTPAESRFGFAVAQAGDRLNIPGRTIFVSAVFQNVVPPGGNVPFADAGTVYVYEIAANGVSLDLVQTIAPPAPTTDGRFGYALAYDTSTDILYVGASGEEVDGNAGAGAVYAYRQNASGTWEEDFRITSPDVQAGAAFGQSLAVADDVLVVGAPSQDVGADSDAGAAYVYDTVSALPVELVAFEAELDGTAARLAWQTATETNNAGFHVEHRMPGASSFADAGFVSGAGTTIEARAYTFRVPNLAPGTHAFRLRQVDVDGTATRSPVVRVTVMGTRGVSAVWPNPARQEAQAQVTLDVSGRVEAHVYDVLGRHVTTVYDGTAVAGKPVPLRLNTRALTSGTYLLRVTTPSGATTRRFAVVR